MKGNDKGWNGIDLAFIHDIKWGKWQCMKMALNEIKWKYTMQEEKLWCHYMRYNEKQGQCIEVK